MIYKVPNWSELSNEEKQTLLKKSLTFIDKWLTVETGSPYDLARWKLVNHVVETEIVHVQATNVLDYWIAYTDNILAMFDSSDNKNKWIKIIWIDVINLLINHFFEKQLHQLVRLFIINNYTNLLEDINAV